MQGIFRKENTDKALKYGIYRHLPTYEKIIRNLVSFSIKILSFFTDVSALKKPLRTLKFKIYVSMGIKKGKTVYNKILARMGCGDYKKWNIALFETKYFL